MLENLLIIDNKVNTNKKEVPDKPAPLFLFFVYFMGSGISHQSLTISTSLRGNQHFGLNTKDFMEFL